MNPFETIIIGSEAFALVSCNEALELENHEVAYKVIFVMCGATMIEVNPKYCS